LLAATSMYYEMTPTALGTWRAGFKSGFTSYADDRQVDISFYEMNAQTNITSTVENFIRTHLDNDYPIAALNTAVSNPFNLPNGNEMTTHWVTFTKYQKYEDFGEPTVKYITVSNVGYQRVWNYETWYELANYNQVVHSYLIVPH